MNIDLYEKRFNEMIDTVAKYQAEAAKWKRLYETVVVKDEGMELYGHINTLVALVQEVVGQVAWLHDDVYGGVQVGDGSLIDRLRKTLGVK